MAAASKRLLMGFRPESVRVHPTAAPGRIPGTVDLVEFTGRKNL